MRGLTGSQKRAVRNQVGMQMGQQQFQEELSLDKQAKAAVGAWEAAKATRETMGLPPISPELDKQFWNGNVQKQLAMVQQMGILTDEHLKQKHGTQQQEQRQAETADQRRYQEQQTAEERAYIERIRGKQTEEQRRATADWRPLVLDGKPTRYATNSAGNLISIDTGEKREPTAAEINAAISEGWSVTRGPQGTTFKRAADKEPRQLPVRQVQDATSGKWLNFYEDGTYDEAKPRGSPAPALTAAKAPTDYKSVAEAEAAKLPKGTIITINGRKARVN